MIRRFSAAGLFLVLAVVALTATAYAEVLPPPLKQLAAGVSPEDVQCNHDRILVIRDDGSPACVYAETAQRMGWQEVAAGHVQERTDPTADDATYGRSETKTVTLYGPPSHEGHADTAEPRMFTQPWTSLSYPETFELGQPFTMNYTWSFLKTFSELHGDEYPPANLERYPWAYGWGLNDTWDDEDGNTWWQIATGRDYDQVVIEIATDKRVHLLTDGYTDGYFGQDRYRPHSLLADGFLIHPYNQIEDNRGIFTLRIDEPIHPRRNFVNAHQLQINIGLYGHYPLYVHFDGKTGHIGTEKIRFFDSERNVRAEVEKPSECISDKRWDGYTYDQKRHMVTYNTWQCDQREYSVQNGTVQTLKELLEVFGITENIREYLVGTLDVPPDVLEEFFEKYPELAGLFVLPSYFLPEAHATHGDDHDLFVYGNFRITDAGGRLVSPVGMKVCLFDWDNTGSHDVLKRQHGRMQYGES